jgi:hypothetical protein
MSRKLNNKTLLILLLGLIGILVITKLITSKKSVRTLDTELVQIDTSQVTSMKIYPMAENGQEILFERNEGKWSVSMNGISGVADRNSVRNSLSELINLKTERLVSRTEDKWGEFHVNDSLGTRVVIQEGRKKTLDLVIGRFDYQPPPGGYQGYGQNRFSGVSYVRKSSDAEVYAVQGFLAMSFNQNFNTWRDQSFLSFASTQLTKIIYKYPADTGFIALKSQSGWMVSGLPADSASMAQYLNAISRKRSSDFEDGFQPSSPPEYEVTFEGDNMIPMHIRAFSQPGGGFILNSSLNPDSWFHSSRDGLFAQLFKRPEDFLPETGDPATQ